MLGAGALLAHGASAQTLVAAFPFDEGSGTTTLDLSTNHNAATLNGAAWTAGKFSHALAFNGTSSYAEAPVIAALDLGPSATFEAWVLLAAVPGDESIILNRWSESGDDEYLVSVWPDGAARFAWHTSAATCPMAGAPCWNALNSTGHLPLNVWTHVAVVRNAVQVSFYLDGALDSSFMVADTNPFRPGTNSLRIGGQLRQAGRVLNGSIDEVRIYNGALTAARIKADMLTPLSGGSADGGCDANSGCPLAQDGGPPQRTFTVGCGCLGGPSPAQVLAVMALASLRRPGRTPAARSSCSGSRRAHGRSC
jgi:hypothetical protein